MRNIEITKYFRWIVGSVLLIAGILKIFTPENLVEVFLFFGISTLFQAYTLVYAVALFEITLAIGLILKYKLKLTGSMAVGLCIIFLLISIVGYANEWQLACGCLGEFTYGNFDLFMVSRNTILLVLAGGILKEGYERKTPDGDLTKTKRG